MFDHFVLKKPIIVYKKVFVASKNNRPRSIPVLATLQLPKGTRVYGECYEANRQIESFERGKYRASKAQVLSLKTIGGKRKVKTAFPWWDTEFIYEVGETVKPTKGFSRKTDLCAGGIHFFYSKEEAIDWEL